MATGAGDVKPVLKRVIKNCWDPRSQIGGSTDGRVPQKSPDNPEGIRPGQNIEDAERAPLEDLLFGHHHEGQAPKKSVKSKKHRRGQPGLNSTSDADVDYFIDPITNRKVHKSQDPDTPIRSLGSYRSQFTQFTVPSGSATQAPIFYDGPPPEAELKKYSQIKLDDSELGFSLFGAIAQKHQGVSWHDNHGVVSPKFWSLGPKTSEYTDLPKYNQLLDEQPLPPNQQAGIQYGDLDKYGAVRYREPDRTLSKQEPADRYEDLDSYTAFRSHEPDGKYKIEEDSGAVEHKDLDKDETIRAHDPDGKYKDTEDGINQQYEDLDRYGFVRSHEPDGKYKADQEASVQQYEDLDKYGPVRAYEPDGKYKAQEDAAAKRYEDLDKYGAVKAHEPDGKYKAEADAAVASEVDPEELRKYDAFRSHEPDGLYAVNYVKSDPDAEELAQYKPFRSHEPDGKYAAAHENNSEDRVEEARYQAFRSHEPDGKYATGYQVDPTTDNPDLGSYGPFRSHEPGGKYAAEQLESATHPRELGQDKAVRSHEPHGKYAAQSESCTEVPDLGNHEAFGYEDTETNSLNPGHEIGADLKEYKTVYNNEADKQTTSHVREKNHSAPIPLEETEKSEYRQLQELMMSEAATEDSTESPIGNLSLDSANDNPTSSEVLTGNYVRDFPEEFSQSWCSTNSAHDSSLLPSNRTLPSQENTQNHRSEEVNSSLRSPNALESALDRHQKPGRGLVAGKPNPLDPYSKEPQGLETSYVQECGKDVPVIATIFNPTPPRPDSGTAVPSTSAEMSSECTPPTLYKVLVYDATSDSVEIAETTSIVPDHSAPLTPSEVLLRISNPSKFIPHFSALQAQGYEIVSGNGDVLIFRKVRESVQETPDRSNPSPTGTHSEPSQLPSNQPPVNPIDMTGGGLRDIDVAASRFASPTGFVNYDLPPLHYTPRSSYPSPQGTESGLDVGQEHSVPDQTKSETSKESSRHRESKSLPRRVLVGAVWAGALSYSLAVVGEYFKTGGTDGKGTRGRL